MMKEQKPVYGIDAPGVILVLALCAAVFMPSGWLLAAHLGPKNGPQWSVIGNTLFAVGAVCLLEVLLMVWSSMIGKFHARDKLLDGLNLKGDEKLLDVGCGHGLLLIAAARRLPRGRAFGIDIWSQRDQSRNSAEATMANAKAAGVANRVELQTGDMRKMPFADASFDAVVASLSIHNIAGREGRREAIREIVRVLKPGGKVALLDIARSRRYADDLSEYGMQAVRVSGLNFWIFPPVRTVTGEKPLAAK